MSQIETVKNKELQQFDPKSTVTDIHKFEAAETYYKKARNAEGLCEAIEEKLKRQREFVLWYGQQPKKVNRHSSDDGTVTASDYQLDPKTISRWKAKLSTTEHYEITLSDAIAKALLACEGKGDPIHGIKTVNDEWYTPELYINLARGVMGGIDTDPASNPEAQKIVKAKTYYTKDDDGLSKSWTGRTWINPPFSDVLMFAEKLIGHLEAGEVSQAIVLTNNNTDTLWWHKMAEVAQGICFTRGRISFYNQYGESSAPTNGQCFFYFGENKQGFTDAFYAHGLIL